MIMRVTPASSPRAPERPVWLVIFADLIALLLAFFVLLYAMQRVEYGAWEALVESLSRNLQPKPAIELPKPAVDENVYAFVRPTRAIDLSYLEVLLRSRRESEGALAGIMLRRIENQLVIVLPGDLVFMPGEATPVAAAMPGLLELASVLRNINNHIEVHGHSDPSPVDNEQFRSNWELSLARAVAVADRLRAFGYPRPIATFGFADTRFGDVASVEPRARRLTLARRVEIVIRSTTDAGK